MSAQTELAVVPPQETALAVYSTEKGLEPWLQQIRAEIDGFIPDISSRKGREAIASMAHKIARSKTALEAVGKKVSADLKLIPKKVDAERKRVWDTLEAWQEEVRRPLNEWQAAEDARVERHNAAIAHIKLNAEALEGITSEDLADRIAKVEAVALGEQWQEFEAEAARAKDDSLKVLRTALSARQQYEAEQAELARLRAEAEAREKADREAAIAREAAERERREAEERAAAERAEAARREQALIDQAAAQQRAAEQAARDAEAAAERQRLNLQLQAEQAERARIQAEADRVAAEQRVEQERQAAAQRAEQAAEQARIDERRRADAAAAEIVRQQQARERDQAHKIKIMGEAKEALMSMNITEELAKAIVLKIARREVPNITINF